MNSRRFVPIVLSVLALASVALAAAPAAAASPTVSLSTAIVGVREGNSGTTTSPPITVTLSATSTSTVSVAWTTVDGTATVADGDYVAKSGTLTFAPGITSQTITVQVNGDTKLEDYQTFTVKLTSVTGAGFGNRVEKVQIQNDETPKLAMAAVKVNEGSPAAFKPKLLQAYYAPITLSATTSNGTAIAPGDYTAVTAQPVTFAAGSKIASVNVPTISDGITEGSETFSLQISGGGVVPATMTKTATILPSLCQGATAPAKYDHVVLVVMENKHYTDVIGNPSAPWITNLAKSCATDKAYAQAASPSRPNYLAMTAGSIFNCAGSDADPAVGNCTPTSGSVYKQVIDNGGTALAYAQGMNGNCDMTSHGNYAVKHNPWPYFSSEATLCQQFDQPMPPSLDVNQLPTLLTLFPDQCNDMHSCSVATGDTWLSGFLQPVFNSTAYLNGSTAVIVTWDEYTNLPNVFASTSVTPAKTVTSATSHYGLLRTIEDMLGYTSFLGNATGATSLRSAMHL